jgi:hypothetical protein
VAVGSEIPLRGTWYLRILFNSVHNNLLGILNVVKRTLIRAPEILKFGIFAIKYWICVRKINGSCMAPYDYWLGDWPDTGIQMAPNSISTSAYFHN